MMPGTACPRFWLLLAFACLAGPAVVQASPSAVDFFPVWKGIVAAASRLPTVLPVYGNDGNDGRAADDASGGSLERLAADLRHSRGLDEVLRINAENDGLEEDCTKRLILPTAVQLAADFRHSRGTWLVRQINVLNDGLGNSRVARPAAAKAQSRPPTTKSGRWELAFSAAGSRWVSANRAVGSGRPGWNRSTAWRDSSGCNCLVYGGDMYCRFDVAIPAIAAEPAPEPTGQLRVPAPAWTERVRGLATTAGAWLSRGHASLVRAISRTASLAGKRGAIAVGRDAEPSWHPAAGATAAIPNLGL